jgi:hypothetical protein
VTFEGWQRSRLPRQRVEFVELGSQRLLVGPTGVTIPGSSQSGRKGRDWERGKEEVKVENGK